MEFGRGFLFGMEFGRELIFVWNLVRFFCMERNFFSWNIFFFLKIVHVKITRLKIIRLYFFPLKIIQLKINFVNNNCSLKNRAVNSMGQLQKPFQIKFIKNEQNYPHKKPPKKTLVSWRYAFVGLRKTSSKSVQFSRSINQFKSESLTKQTITSIGFCLAK